MLLGILIGRKSYTVKKFLVVILIVVGVIVFSWKEKPSDKERNNQIIGMGLILASLLMDGLMGGSQDRMRSVKRPTSLNLMHFLNAWSSLYLIGLLICTLEGLEFIRFCSRHPIILRDLSIVVFVGSIAQYFISDLIKNFGALPLSITLTIRKFITVFLSVLIYGNILLVRQWIAASLIFIALLADALIQKPKDKVEHENADKEMEMKVEAPGEKIPEPEEAGKMIQS
jgi:UDP-galactose transporter B1